MELTAAGIPPEMTAKRDEYLDRLSKGWNLIDKLVEEGAPLDKVRRYEEHWCSLLAEYEEVVAKPIQQRLAAAGAVGEP